MRGRRYLIAVALFILPGGIALAAIYLAASRRGRSVTARSTED
jgi:hypothetical protein